MCVFINSIFIFIYFLIIYNFTYHLFDTNIEGLENNNSVCQADLSTMVYKNNGTIQILQDSIDKLSKQINQLILSNDKQDSQINNLTNLETKYDNIANQANQLALYNKSRLIQLAKEAQQKGKDATNASNKLPSIK